MKVVGGCLSGSCLLLWRSMVCLQQLLAVLNLVMARKQSGSAALVQLPFHRRAHTVEVLLVWMRFAAAPPPPVCIKQWEDALNISTSSSTNCTKPQTDQNETIQRIHLMKISWDLVRLEEVLCPHATSALELNLDTAISVSRMKG